MPLLRPQLCHLDSYIEALKQGWSPNNLAGPEDAKAELERITADPVRFIEGMEDLEARGGVVKLPDGSEARRIPGFRRWMWDGEFCGSINFRWQPGTTELPPHCLGHIGFSVVPWKQRRGVATQALRELLPEAWAVGLPFVEITTDPDNIPSQRVIEANGGVLHEQFLKAPQFGGTMGLRYRIYRSGA